MDDLIYAIIFLVGFVTIMGGLMAFPYALGFLTYLETRPKDHWFHRMDVLMDEYGRSKSALYIIPAPLLFAFLAGASEFEGVGQLLKNIAAIGLTLAWFFYTAWPYLFYGKRAYESPYVIGVILFFLAANCWVNPDYSWFFSMYGYAISSLWSLNIFRHRANSEANA